MNTVKQGRKHGNTISHIRSTGQVNVLPAKLQINAYRHKHINSGFFSNLCMQHLPICKYNPILHIPSTCLSMLTKLTAGSRLCCQVACHFVCYQIYLRYFVRTYLSPVDEVCAGFDIAIASFVAKYTQNK